MKRRLCSLAELPEGQAQVIEVDGVSLAAARSGHKVFVLENRCSHDDGPLGEGPLVEVPGAGLQIECPRHGARFDLATGRPTRMPAVSPIESYRAWVEGDVIVVEMPDRT